MWTTCWQIVTSLALPFALTCAAQGQCPPEYQVQPLYGELCKFTGYGGTALRGINDLGNACGGIGYCGKGADMVIWNGERLLLQVPLSIELDAQALSINSDNVIAGIIELTSGQNRGFMYEDDKFLILNPLSSHIWTETYSISNDGTSVGFSGGGSEIFAVKWENLLPSVVDLPFGPSSIAYDISPNGLYMCGWMGIDPSPHFGAMAFRWHDGDVVHLGVLPGTTSSEAKSVNNLGDACGIAYTAVGKYEMIRHGFFWSNGVMQNMGLLPDFVQTHALDLNDAKQVVGYCDTWPLSSFNHGFVWKDGFMFDLNDLIPPELDLTIRIACGINNAGQIVAYAIDGEGNQVGAILTPIPSAIGDFDFNCIINVDDLLGVINHWEQTSGPGDFNQDGVVDAADLEVVIRNWTM